MIIEMNNIILKDTNPNKNNENNNDDNNNSDETNQGTIIVDATCTPADITYPQDLNLLNSAREKLEGYIDCLHDSSESKKPRTYRNRKNLNYCKENGISITGPALGRPKKNKTTVEKNKSMLIHVKEMKLRESLALVKLDMV